MNRTAFCISILIFKKVLWGHVALLFVCDLLGISQLCCVIYLYLKLFQQLISYLSNKLLWQMPRKNGAQLFSVDSEGLAKTKGLKLDQKNFWLS